ncbi:MAG TPA: hypothetical protein VNL94_04080 [Candidatus Binatia bacterium]|nr:hypothetical protein [Candidatus Binatia bacterium]
MNRSRIRRFLGLTAVAALTLAALGIAPAAAKTPDWSIVATRLPVTVAPGKAAGYSVVVENKGTSTINRAKLTVTPTSTPNATPAYFSGLSWSTGGPETSCTSTGKLICELGTMAAGNKFTFVVAYDVPANESGTFDVTFFLEAGTGNVTGKNKSRGDALEVISKTGVNNSQNFSAGFAIDGGSYATTGDLGRNNKQTSQADVTDELVTVTVEDGISSDPNCTIDACNDVIGEWTRLTVPGNQDYIKVTLNIWGHTVPGGVQPNDIVLLHVLDDGTIDVIGDVAGERCASPATEPPASGECILVTKVGSNYRIVAWLLHNGTLRGGF